MNAAGGVLGRAGLAACLLGAWFVTMAGGWADVGRLFAGEASGAVVAGTPGAVDAAGEVGAAVSGTVLAGGDLFGLPTRLAVWGDELVVLDRYRTEPVVTLDRRTGRLLRGFGREGDGPGEFRSPVALAADDAGVVVLDVGLGRFTRLAPEPGGFALRATARLGFDGAATELVTTATGELVVAGFTPDGRLARLDAEGGMLGYEGRATDLEGLSPEGRMEALQGTLRATPSRDRFVRTHRFASHLEIVDAATGESTIVDGPQRFGPRPGDHETRFGYLDSAPFADGFFALYSGRTRTAYPERANYADEVHEYGWDGRLRAKHRLDADVIAIAWSEEDGLLYAARHDPIPEVVMYRLRR